MAVYSANLEGSKILGYESVFVRQGTDIRDYSSMFDAATAGPEKQVSISYTRLANAGSRISSSRHYFDLSTVDNIRLSAEISTYGMNHDARTRTCELQHAHGRMTCHALCKT